MRHVLVAQCTIVGCIHLRGNYNWNITQYPLLCDLETWVNIFLLPNRFLHTLKRKVKNKARVEGSICEAYITEETSTFCSHYFGPDVQSRIRRGPQNDYSVDLSPDNSTFSISNHFGRPSSAYKDRILDDREIDRATLYVLLNCDEVQPYIK